MALAYRSDRFTHDIDARILDNHTAVTQAVYDIARRRGPPHVLAERAGNHLHAGRLHTSRTVERRRVMSVSACADHPRISGVVHARTWSAQDQKPCRSLGA